MSLSASIYALHLCLLNNLRGKKGCGCGRENVTAVCRGSDVLLPSTRSITAALLRLLFILLSVERHVFQFYQPLFH